MRRLTLLLVSLVLLSIQSVLAQSFSVKGTVVSAEDNEPMIGVTIMQEGTSNGVVTDIDGNYTIEIKGASKATLVYSYVGCKVDSLPSTPGRMECTNDDLQPAA